MEKVVTIGLPIYKRLKFLPRVLEIVQSQDYPAIDLLVSDNGKNGTQLQDMLQSRYRRPYRFRQNAETVSPGTHFNQVLNAATGDYFVLLADDDEISSNFVSELVAGLEKHPSAVLGFGAQETVDPDGVVLAKSIDLLPEKLTGPEFILATWERYQLGFGTVITFVGKTQLLRDCGGYPDFTRGNCMDDALVIKMCAQGEVVFSSKCVFRNLVEGASLGWGVSTQQLAAAVREFIEFLDTDETLRQFAVAKPVEWRSLRECLRRSSWGMYLSRWNGMYRERLGIGAWMRAAFFLPWIPGYYKQVGRILLRRALSFSRDPVGGSASEKVQPLTRLGGKDQSVSNVKGSPCVE